MNLQVDELLKSWSRFIVSKDTKKLLNLYDENALLKPTLSDKIRKTKKEILHYFIGGGKFNDYGFLKQGVVQVKFLESNLICLESGTVNTGKYQFLKEDGSSQVADYTFVLKKIDKDFKIIVHHSSLEFKSKKKRV